MSAQTPVVRDSVFAVPFQAVDLQPIQQVLDQSVPSGMDGEGAWSPPMQGGVMDKISWQRDNFTITASDNTITLATQVHYAIRLSHLVGHAHLQFAQCGHGEPEATMGVGLNLTLTPQSDWSIKAQPSVLLPTPGNPCNLGVVNYDASHKISDILDERLQSELATIQQDIDQKLQFKTEAAGIWQKLEMPISLGSNAYLVATLDGAYLSPVSANNDQISISGGISGQLKIIAGQPVSVPQPPLPPLQITKVSPGFNIELPVTVSYYELSQQLNSRLAGHRYPFDGHTATITSISVYGTTDYLVLQIGISLNSFVGGTIYILGKPEYDSLNQVLYADNVGYTLDTQNVLVKSANWLLHSQFLATIQGAAHYKIADQITGAEMKATAALNRPIGPHATLSGSITNLSLLGIALSSSDVTAFLNVQGQAAVAIH